MIKTKINGCSKDFPEGWGEVTMRQFTVLSVMQGEGSKKSEQIRYLLGIDKGVKVEGLESLYRLAHFLSVAPEIEETPTKLGTYQLSQDITADFTEQFEDISAEITRVQELGLQDKLEALAYYAAVYIQPKWFSSSYDSEQARHLSKILLDYPCQEVVSAGSFFQAKSLSSESGLPLSYLRKNIPLKRKASGSFLGRLVSMRLSIWWLVIRVSIQRWFSKRGQSKDSTQR